MASFLIIVLFIWMAYRVSMRPILASQKRASKEEGARRPAALPHFYGYIGSILMTGVLGLFSVAFTSTEGPKYLLEHLPFLATQEVNTLFYAGLFLVGALTLGGLPLLMTPSFRARHFLERWGRGFFFGAALVAVLITSVVVVLLLSESIRFFNLVPVQDFLFGQVWAPEISHGVEAEEGAHPVKGQYGALPLFAGTFLITGVSLVVGGGLGLMVAIYTSQFAKPLTRTFLKPALEILAGIPTIVYGFFALAVVAPLLHSLGEFLHLSISSESALGAGLVMGLMILPIISSLSDDALSSLPGALKQNALAMGATSTEAIRTVLVPAAFPGIMSSFLLAVSRATGETMLVLMAASLQPNLTGNPLEAVTTVTVQIVSLLTGDQEFDSAKTLSAFALALVLFLLTLSLNILALFFVNRHARRYEL